IAHPNARAFQVRLTRAIQQSGIDESDDVRRLFILRRDDWPSGAKTRELTDDFTRRGGVKLDVDLEDLRTFEALRTLRQDKNPALQSWLGARQPASSTKLLRAALSAEVPNGSNAAAVAGVEPNGSMPSGAASSVSTGISRRHPPVQSGNAGIAAGSVDL